MARNRGDVRKGVKQGIMLTAEEISKVWKQVPDLPIWQNPKTGEYVAVHGSEDAAYFVVRKTTPVEQERVYTSDVSPYFVLRKTPVGDYGRSQNSLIKTTKNWQYGTVNDAIAWAMGVMSKSVPKRRTRRY